MKKRVSAISVLAVLMLSLCVTAACNSEEVVPDPTWTHTSVDGGVTWINVPLGEYQVTAEKPDVNYDTVSFDVNEADAASGVVLYIASPPDSVQGDNDSGPGEN